MLTDEDMEAIQRIEKKYAVHLTLAGFNDIDRSIYLIESKGQLPPPRFSQTSSPVGGDIFMPVLAEGHQDGSSDLFSPALLNYDGTFP